jgi:TPR repeat protein
MDKFVNHYDELEVTRNASDFVIKAAYKALCQTYHPDKFEGSKEVAENKLKLVNKAYAILSNPDKRAAHDREIDEHKAKTKKQREKHQFHDYDEPTDQHQYQQKREKPKTEGQPQSKYSKPNSTPPPNTNAGSQSISRTSGWLRFFARMFDVWWETLIVTYFLAFFLARYSTGFMEWLGNTPNADKTFVLLCIPIALILDATIYSVFGNTPGKAWLGLNVKDDDGMPLDFSQYLGRNLKFYVSGFALGLPIIGLFPMVNQSIRLRKGRQASYDESTGFRVYEQPVGWLHKPTFGLAFVCLFLVLSVLNSMGKNNQQEATPIAKQETNDNNATTQSEHQLEGTNKNYRLAVFLYEQGNYMQALPLFQSLANQGYAEPQNYLGSMYYNGNGVNQDFTQAVYWYQKAAEQGSFNAQVSMGWFYMSGLGNLPKDYKLAAYWNTLGTNNGHPEGANNLGWQYEHGLGVAQDLNKAVELYQYAINKGIELGVQQERIDEAKNRLANLTKFRQLNKPSDKKVVVTETNDTLRVNIDDEKKFEIRGNLPKLKKEMSGTRLSPVHRYESDSDTKVIKSECIIKPVMTKAELQNCQN